MRGLMACWPFYNSNYNYGQAGTALGVDLLNNPDLVATNVEVSFKTALWFWMTPQGNKPSCHDVITGKWTPSDIDKSAGLVPGYGVITNIINGRIECRYKPDTRVEKSDRVLPKVLPYIGSEPWEQLGLLLSKAILSKKLSLSIYIYIIKDM